MDHGGAVVHQGVAWLKRFVTLDEQQMLVARARPVLPEGGAIYTDFTPNVQKVLLGQSTPAQGMNAVAAAWKTKLFRTYTIKKN